MGASSEAFRQFCERDSAERVADLVEINETLLSALEDLYRGYEGGKDDLYTECVNARNAIRLAKGMES